MVGADEDLVFSPRYVEGYPQLRVAPAVRGARTGFSLVLWRDETGEPIGSSTLRLEAADRLAVNPTLFGTRSVAESDTAYDVAMIRQQAGQFRMEDYGICECGRAVKVLILKHGSWKCSACHRLVNRSALVGPAIRRVEQLHKVTQELGSGRRPGMHNSTYQRLLDERERLEEKLAGFRGVANVNYVPRVTAEFVRPVTGWSS